MSRPHSEAAALSLAWEAEQALNRAGATAHPIESLESHEDSLHERIQRLTGAKRKLVDHFMGNSEGGISDETITDFVSTIERLPETDASIILRTMPAGTNLA